MTWTLSVHPSQLPDAVRSRLLEGLRRNRLPSRFLYDSLAQATRWLQVHEVHSPARTDPSVIDLYTSLARNGPELRASHVLSLGSGGGQKDRALLDALGFGTGGRTAVYLPLDTSPTLALQSAQVCAAPGRTLRPWIADLEAPLSREALGIEAEADLAVFAFGLTPNFDSGAFFELLRGLLRPGEPAYISVNASPEPHRPGSPSIDGIEAQYDNPETRAWMLGALAELGLEREQVELQFESVPTGPDGGTWQIRARAGLSAPRLLNVLGEAVQVRDGFQVFFSNRVWADRLVPWVEGHGFSTLAQVVSASREEAVISVTPHPGQVRRADLASSCAD